MDSLKDLLRQKDIDEPSELIALKNYCQENYQFEPKITVKNNLIHKSKATRKKQSLKNCNYQKSYSIKKSPCKEKSLFKIISYLISKYKAVATIRVSERFG